MCISLRKTCACVFHQRFLFFLRRSYIETRDHESMPVATFVSAPREPLSAAASLDIRPSLALAKRPPPIPTDEIPINCGRLPSVVDEAAAAAAAASESSGGGGGSGDPGGDASTSSSNGRRANRREV